MTCTVLAIEYRSLAALHAAYMPLFTHGGLFVRGHTCAALGRRHFLLVTLPGQAEPHAVLARSAWIQPSNDATRLPAGVGLVFEPTATPIRGQIESLLATGDFEGEPTHTF